MKSKWHNQFVILNYITSTQRYKLVFLITLIVAFYGSFILGLSADNFVDAIYVPFQFPIFNVFLISLFILNTFNLCSIINKNFSYYIIRLKTKNNYVKELLKNTLFVNLFNLLIFFLLYFSILLFFKFGNYQVVMYQNYNVNTLFYIIFYLIRYIFIVLMICSISTLLFINFKSRVVLTLNGIFLTGLLFFEIFSWDVVTIQLLPWAYFTRILFASFSIEIFNSILVIFLLGILLYFLFLFTLKNKKWVIA